MNEAKPRIMHGRELLAREGLGTKDPEAQEIWCLFDTWDIEVCLAALAKHRKKCAAPERKIIDEVTTTLEIAKKIYAEVTGKTPPHAMSTKPDENAWFCGFATALAELHRRLSNSTGVCEVASAAGLTLRVARTAGVDSFDWKELRRAGVQ